MGKKYIIELEETPFIQHFKNGAWETIYRVKGFNNLVFDWNGLQMLTPYTEPDLEQVRKETYEKGFDAGRMLNKGKYEKGINDAWEAARTLWNTVKRKEIFGYTVFSTALMALTGQEAIEKIRQYEQEKEEKQHTWIFSEVNEPSVDTTMICSKCGYTITIKPGDTQALNFCPKCGDNKNMGDNK